MTRRRTPFWLAALVVAAAISQFLVWWLTPPPPPVAVVGPPRSSYTLTDFTLRAFGKDGRLSFTMTAPHLARRGSDQSLYVNAPKYQFITSDGAAWYGTSQYAWVSANDDVVKLIGKVDMHRPPTANASAAEIHTSDATVWTQAKRMATKAPSVIEEPGSILRGVGMRANFDTHTLELLSDVHATLTPQSHAR